MSPTFINYLELGQKITQTNFYNQQKDEILSGGDREFYGSIVSLDRDFINWIKLRLGYFEDILQNEDPEFKNSFVSDGISGSFSSVSSNISPLKYNGKMINPDVILQKYKSVLSLYYSMS
jgi:hypothetical protein